MDIDPQLSPSDIGWVAGIVDGEGCIMLIRQTRGPNQRPGVCDRLVIKVSSTDPRMLQRLRHLVGGRISSGMVGKGNRRMHWDWIIVNKGAKDILRAILPHLTVKAEQAEVALEFTTGVRGGGRGHKLDPIEDALRQDIQGRLRVLKRASFEEAI